MTAHITAIETIPFAIPLTGSVTFATGKLTAAEHLLVRVHCDAGVVGHAEAIPRPMIYGETLVSIAHAIDTLIAPAMVGMEIHSTRQIEHRLRNVAGNVAARSSVELALFDLIGKVHNVSCHQLLGGYTDSMRCTQILGSGDAARLSAEMDKLAAEAGIDSFKIKVGLNLGHDIDLVLKLREHAPDALLYVDANHGFTAAEAVQFARATAGALAWIEEPCSADEVMGRADVLQAATVPILADESGITTREVVGEVLGRRSSMVGLKLQRTGIHTSERIREFAAALGVPVLVASQGDSAIGTHASVSVAAASPVTSSLPAELAYFRLLEDDLTIERPAIKAGRMSVPAGAGFGLEIDADKLARYRTDRA